MKFGKSSQVTKLVEATELRLITIHYLNDSSGPYEAILPVDHVDRFVLASIKLHYQPGINPHNGKKTTPIVKITSQALKPGGPYWWSNPDLQNNDDPRGALIFDWDHSPETLWECP